MKKVFNLIYPICAMIWLWYFGKLMTDETFVMNWFAQVMASWTSIIAMITFWFEAMEN
jgi:hypothetical protein